MIARDRLESAPVCAQINHPATEGAVVNAVAEALALFETRASARGWDVHTEPTQRAIRRGEACLRLRENAGVLVLEITHGPAHAPAAWWLELYAEPPDPRPEMPTLDESIIHGLELMGPNT